MVLGFPVKRIHLLAVPLILWIALTPETSEACVCVQKEATISQIVGKVIFPEDLTGGQEQTIPGATVTLHQQRKGQRLKIASLKTDQAGEFAFEGIPPGLYLIEVTGVSGFEFDPVEVKLRGWRRASRKVQTTLVLVMDTDPFCCPGELQTRTKAVP